MNARIILAAALFAAAAAGTSSDAAAQRDTAERDRAQRDSAMIVLVTGSTDGLGREVARRLAASGAHVIVHGRNRERGEALVREIAAEGKGSAKFYAADLASLEQVRALARDILQEYDRLDVLVNNAGIWLNATDERQVSADGYELHFSVNYLAGYALTRLLLPRLISARGRIVNVASAAQTPLDFSDIMLERNYSASRAYGQSKLAQILFTQDLAAELDTTGVIVAALHPATLMDTNMVREAGVRARSTVAEGADAVMQVITSPDVRNGDYFSGLRAARASAQAYDEAARAQLRALSARLTGVPAGR